MSRNLTILPFFVSLFYTIVAQKHNILNVVSHKPSVRSVQSVIFYSPVFISEPRAKQTKPNIFTSLNKRHAPKREEKFNSEQIFLNPFYVLICILFKFFLLSEVFSIRLLH